MLIYMRRYALSYTRALKRVRGVTAVAVLSFLKSQMCFFVKNCFWFAIVLMILSRKSLLILTTLHVPILPPPPPWSHRQVIAEPAPENPDGFVWEEDALERAVAGLCQQADADSTSLEGTILGCVCAWGCGCVGMKRMLLHGV